MFINIHLTAYCFQFVLQRKIPTIMPPMNQPAPAFAGTAVVNGEFKEVDLKQYKGKYLVLFFYPLDL